MGQEERRRTGFWQRQEFCASHGRTVSSSQVGEAHRLCILLSKRSDVWYCKHALPQYYVHQDIVLRALVLQVPALVVLTPVLLMSLLHSLQWKHTCAFHLLQLGFLGASSAQLALFGLFLHLFAKAPDLGARHALVDPHTLLVKPQAVAAHGSGLVTLLLSSFASETPQPRLGCVPREDFLGQIGRNQGVTCVLLSTGHGPSHAGQLKRGKHGRRLIVEIGLCCVQEDVVSGC